MHMGSPTRFRGGCCTAGDGAPPPPRHSTGPCAAPGKALLQARLALPLLVHSSYRHAPHWYGRYDILTPAQERMFISVAAAKGKVFGGWGGSPLCTLCHATSAASSPPVYSVLFQLIRCLSACIYSVLVGPGPLVLHQWCSSRVAGSGARYTGQRRNYLFWLQPI